MLGSDDANLLVNAAHHDEEEGGDANVAVGNQHRRANNVLDTPWYVHCNFIFYVLPTAVICAFVGG